MMMEQPDQAPALTHTERTQQRGHMAKTSARSPQDLLAGTGVLHGHARSKRTWRKYEKVL